MRNFIAIALLSLIGSESVLGSTIRISVDSLTQRQQVLVENYLNHLFPWDGARATIGEQSVTLPCTDSTDDVCSDFREGSAVRPFGFQQIQKIWMRHYLTTRTARANEGIVTDDLASFIAVTGYRTWDHETLYSQIKRQTRRIFRGVVEGRKVSVAETTGTENGEEIVRETELAIESLAKPGSNDFYVYSPSGELVNESEFPAGIRPAPMICVGCHMNNATRQTTNFFPR